MMRSRNASKNACRPSQKEEEVNKEVDKFMVILSSNWVGLIADDVLVVDRTSKA